VSQTSKQQTGNNEFQSEITSIITKLGEDTTREGLLKTPERVQKALKSMTSGYKMELKDILNDAIFEEDIEEMIVVNNIEFYSMCEHHMLPFFGVCHVGYIPNGKIVGLSKIPRIINMFSRRLQVQERLTRDIAQTIEEAIQPKGVAVVTEASHLCMMMRGVEKQQSKTISSSMLGRFRNDAKTRSEFLEFIKNR
jgi:GTP cyclohydrolase I